MNGAGGAARSSHPDDTGVLDPPSMTRTVMDDESAAIPDVDVFHAWHSAGDHGYLVNQGCEPTGRWKSRGSMLSADRLRLCVIQGKEIGLDQ